MTYQFRPEASAVNPANAPSWVAVIPAGGAAGVTRPLMPSHHTLHGTTTRSTTNRTMRMVPTITQFDSSRALLIFRAAAVMTNTSTSRAIAYQRVACTSSGAATRPLTQRKDPLPRRGRPAPGDERKDHHEGRERYPERRTRRHPPPAQNRHLPGRHDVSRALDVVEGL